MIASSTGDGGDQEKIIQNGQDRLDASVLPELQLGDIFRKTHTQLRHRRRIVCLRTLKLTDSPAV